MLCIIYVLYSQVHIIFFPFNLNIFFQMFYFMYGHIHITGDIVNLTHNFEKLIYISI